MTSPDQDQISLDDLFAAVGVSVSEPEPEPEPASALEEVPMDKPVRPRSTARDTTEQDLLSALGISHARVIENKAAPQETVDAEPVDKRDRIEERKARASQWRQELQEAGEPMAPAAASPAVPASEAPVPSSVPEPAPSVSAPSKTPEVFEEPLQRSASEEAVTQPLQATVAALPTLTGGIIRPFGAESGQSRIGVLEGDPSAQQLAGTQSQQGAPSLQRNTPSGMPFMWPQNPQSTGPMPQAGQGVGQMPSAAQPQQSATQSPQQPQAAFQQAQQMPLQPLQPIDQPSAQVATPGQQPQPLPIQPLQQMREGVSLQPVEQQIAQEASQPAPERDGAQEWSQVEVGASQPSTATMPSQAMAQSMQQPMQPQGMPQWATLQPFGPSVPGGGWQPQVAPQAAAQPLKSQAEQFAEQINPEQEQSIQVVEAEQAGMAQMDAPSDASPVSSESTQDKTASFLQQPLVVGSEQPESMQAQGEEGAEDSASPQLGAMQPPAFSENASFQQPLAPQQGLPVMQPPAPPLQPVASGDSLKELDREAKSSKAAHVVGGALIFIALICVVFAICLLTGIIDLSAVNPNRSVVSSTSSSQLSGQAAPSATSSESSSTDGSEVSSSSDGKAGEVVYSYVVRGVDGGTHEAIETATFGEDGKLVSSMLEIQSESQMDSDMLLDQLQQEFGDSIVESSATEDKVVCTVKLPRDDLDRDSYTELLSTNAPEFKVISS